MNPESEILFLALDITPSWWGTHAVKCFGLPEYIDCMLSFLNAHMMMHSENEVVLFATMGDQCHLVWPTSEKNLKEIDSKLQHDGQYEYLAIMNEYVRDAIRTLILNCNETRSTVSFSGTVIRCLCYYLRRCRELQPALMSSAFGEDHVDVSSFGVETAQNIVGNVKARIVVVKAASDCPTQYLALMNAIFTAQKLDVPIDCCSLSPMITDMKSDTEIRATADPSYMRGAHSSLFQQAADLTGGIYLQIPQPSALLQYFITIFLPRKKLRSVFMLPDSKNSFIRSGIDFRAACFCHRQLVDVAYVCSACLSVFCEFTPICSTCQTVYRVPSPLKDLKA